jgi:hypothetical protein
MVARGRCSICWISRYAVNGPDGMERRAIAPSYARYRVVKERMTIANPLSSPSTTHALPLASAGWS